MGKVNGLGGCKDREVNGRLMGVSMGGHGLVDRCMGRYLCRWMGG